MQYSQTPLFLLLLTILTCHKISVFLLHSDDDEKETVLTAAASFSGHFANQINANVVVQTQIAPQIHRETGWYKKEKRVALKTKHVIGDKLSDSRRKK